MDHTLRRLAHRPSRRRWSIWSWCPTRLAAWRGHREYPTNRTPFQATSTCTKTRPLVHCCCGRRASHSWGAADLAMDGFWDWGSGEDESGSTTIRNIGLVIAGIEALIIVMLRSIVYGRRAESAQQQSETGRRALLNDRHERAVELLANRVLAVRLGGIEALRRLAEEDPQHYHLPVVNQFCAFVHHPTPDPDLIQTFVLDSSQGMGVPYSEG